MLFNFNESYTPSLQERRAEGHWYCDRGTRHNEIWESKYLGVHFITKLHFITKCNKSLLQNAPGFYYKMRNFWQNALVQFSSLPFYLGMKWEIQSHRESKVTEWNMKIFIKNLFSKYDQIRREILNGKLYFLCSRFWQFNGIWRSITNLIKKVNALFDYLQLSCGLCMIF